jgi:malate dehydrogenase (oxaloacetate-decarboxylating)(NADP+)
MANVKTAEGYSDSGHEDVYGEDDSTKDLPVTPWGRFIANGMDLLRDPRFNKGTAFTPEDRKHHYLDGLLPPIVLTQDQQMERILHNVRSKADPLQKYLDLMDLQDRNERLFFATLIKHVEELMPIVYTPTVGEACEKYGTVFRRSRGLFITIKDKGKVYEILKNWPEYKVAVIVVTDGERILGLGDLGIQGMGIPVGKLALYTALGGIRPSQCLPITIDVGTDNEKLLNDPFYIGLRQKRVRGQEYDNLLDEFMHAVKRRYGEKVLVQFEDFANSNAFRLLEKYRETHLTFNDDIQGTAAVTLAGLIAALPLDSGNTSMADHRFLFQGAGEAGPGIADLIALSISRDGKKSVEDARKQIYLVDSKGLVTASRGVDSLPDHKKKWAHEHAPCGSLIEAVHALKPTALIGVSAIRGAFDKDVLQAMAKYHKRPIIFSLSNPTSKSECTAEEAYKETNGAAVFASGSPFGPVDVNGKKRLTGQGNNAYIFPGIGLGCIISGSVRVHDDFFLVAAEALASQVTDEDRAVGLVYPPFTRIRKISAVIATAVAERSYELGLASRLPKPSNLMEYAERCMYNPEYRKYY